MTLNSRKMVANVKQGKGWDFEQNVDTVGRAFIRKYQGWAEDEGVFEQLFETLRRNLTAKKTQRIESESREAGYTWEEVQDGMTQVAAARTLAQILRLMPGPGGVNVALTDNSIRISVDQQLSEIASIGVNSADLIAELRDAADRASAAQGGAKTQNPALPAAVGEKPPSVDI